MIKDLNNADRTLKIFDKRSKSIIPKYRVEPTNMPRNCKNFLLKESYSFEINNNSK